MQAYLAVIEARIHAQLARAEERHLETAGLHCDPFASLFIDDCIAKGLDVFQGGARYPACFTFNSMGLGTAVDSLSAIRTFVFDLGKVTLPELTKILERDFDGQESLRAQLEGGTPAYGNDLDDADGIAERVFDEVARAIRSYESPIGAIHLMQMLSYTGHVGHGEIAAATPNGRRAGRTYSDGVGPTQGKDARGLTCLINSVTRLDHSQLTGGSAFNVKLAPSLLGGASGRETLQALLATYVRRGGSQVQVNLVGQETLREAQEHPDDYRHVIVRVAGFCEYFTNLDRKLQDEIIARTSQQEASV